jgi:hypothetical protein
MDQDQFVDEVMFGVHIPHVSVTWRVMQAFEDAAVRLHRDGFSVDDAVAYLSCMEEVDPSLDEDVALERMNSIRAKYPSSQGTILV